jgi:hypothetical protein
MTANLPDLILLYMFSTGRRVFAWNQMRRDDADLRSGAVVPDDSELIWGTLDTHIVDSIAFDRETLTLELGWASQQANRTSPEASRLDPLIDVTLSGIQNIGKTFIRASDEHSETKKLAETLLTTIFPKGVRAVTHLTYVDELAVVQTILGHLRGSQREAVDRLGLEPLVARLETLSGQFRDVLHKNDPKTLTWDQIRAAREQGQRRLLQTVAIVLGRHYGDDPDSVRIRNRMLKPILDQNDTIAAYLRSHRPVQDVDPDSGEISDTSPVDEGSVPTDSEVG